MDRKELTVVGSRLVTLLLGPLTVVAVGTFMDPTVQGYYYTFGSVLAVSVFFEAGVSTAIVQLVAHEASSSEKGDASTGGSARLAGVLRFSIYWYAGSAAFMGTGVLGFGLVVFGGRDDGVSWTTPWVLMVATAVCGFLVQPLFAFLEGLDDVRYVYTYRLVRSLLQSCVLIALIVSGAQLLALPAASAAGVLLGLAFLGARHRRLRSVGWRHGRGAVSWRREILPFQWRLALAWAAGYFSVSLFAPVMMIAQGPVEAGQVGMTVTLMVACTSIAAGFMQAHAPHLGRLHASGRFGGMHALFVRKALLSNAVCVAGVSTLLVAAVLASKAGVSIVDRLVSIPALVAFSIGFAAYHAEGVMAFFLRAQKLEPYYALEVLGGVLIFSSTFFLGGVYGPVGVACGFAAVHGLVLLPLAFVIYRRNRNNLGLPGGWGRAGIATGELAADGEFRATDGQDGGA